MSMFNLQRFANLLQRDWILYGKHLITIALIMMAYCLCLMLIGKDAAAYSVTTTGPSNLTGILLPEILFMNIVGLVGFIFTLLVFKDFRTSQERLQFLQLPASNFEKVFSKWLYSFPGFWILTAIVFFLSYNIFGTLIERYSDAVYPPLAYIRLSSFKYMFISYALGHSVLLLLAIIYNRFVIPKSMLTLIGLAIINMIVLFIIIRLVMYNHFDGWSLRGQDVNFSITFQDNAKWLLHNLPYLFLFIIAPFLWVVSYFKMKEKEL